MNPRNMMILGSVLLGGVIIFSLYGIGQSLASGGHRGWYDHDDDDYEYRYRSNPVQADAYYQAYVEACGECHMAYPPSLLPRQSWDEIMSGLDDHFGDNAELDEPSRHQVREFLQRATRAAHWKEQRMLRNLGDHAPLRITAMPYFRHEHDEIPSAYIGGNDKVASLSQCDACHRNAARGWFDEDDVRIPGVGRWDD